MITLTATISRPDVIFATDRALKRAVLLRKNALFYKNEHGASVGAILQSLIETLGVIPSGYSAMVEFITEPP
jgi:hypothetical protein